MLNRRNRAIALLLSFMMVALNLLSGVGSLYAYAGTDEEAQPATEVATENEQAEETAEEEARDVPFEEEQTVDGVKVKVTADAGVFPEDATLAVEKLSGDEKEAAKEAVDEEAGDADIAKEYLFDISVLDENGNELQPEGTANVSFETEEVADESLEAKVYHVKDNGEAEALDVEAKGEVATVDVDGFSPYSLIFTHVDISTGTVTSYNIRVGQEDELWPVLDEIGIKYTTYGAIDNVVSRDPDIVQVYKQNDTWFFKAVAGDTNEHVITVYFTSGTEKQVIVTSHAHNWTVTGNETAKLTVKCDDDQCYYKKSEYTAQISASDATYDANTHGATKTLTNQFPTDDVKVGDIYYVGTGETSYEASTTAPTNAGTYKAYYTVKPDGSNNSYTVQTTYTIKKADIKFDPEAKAAYPEGVSSLTYNGQDQNLYTPATAKSETAEGQTFSVKYWYSDSTDKVTDQVLTGKNAGTWTIKYQSEGDANHNATEVQTLEIVIAKRPVTISGITASNKTYDGTTAATLDTSNAVFANIVTGDKLTVSATGKFENKNVGNAKTVNISDLALDGESKDNYVLASSGHQTTTTANITQKTIKVHWQSPAELEYTAAEQAPTATFDFGDKLKPDDEMAFTGDKVEPVITGKAKAVGTHRAEVTGLTGDDAGNYKLEAGSSNVDIEYKIIPKKLTVEWTKISEEYDDKALEPTWSLTGFVGGETPEKALTLEADPTALVGGKAVNAGTYKATVALSGETAGNYEITNAESPFTITKAPLTVFAKGWIYYGEKVDENKDIHDLDYDMSKIEGLKGDDTIDVITGDVVFNTNYNFLDPATGVEEAWYYLIPEFDEAANYEVTNEEGELKVYPKPVTLEWTHEHAGQKNAVSGEQKFTYDGKKHVYTAEVSKDSYVKTPSGQQADPDMTVTVSGNVQRDANAKTKTEKYTAYATDLSNPNYALKDKDGSDIATKSVDFTIAQLPVELSWSPAEFTYNAQMQSPTHTIKNLQTNDEGVKDESFGISVEREKTSEVFDKDRDESIEAGNWKLTALNEESGQLEDANYTLKDGSGLEANYVIKPLEVTLKWNPAAKEFVYNAEDQTISVELANIPAADEELVELKTSGTFTAKNAGQYSIKVESLDDTSDSARKDNYTLKAETHPWKINKAPLTVTANAKTITYGDAPANAGVTYSGFKGSDNQSVVKGAAKYSYNYAQYGKPGTYKITPSGLSADNYYFVYKQGNLNVQNKVTKLVAKGIAKGENKGKISWNKVSGATSYEVYLAKCDSKGKKYKTKKVATVKKTSYTAKKLSKNTFYKFYVVANVDGTKVKSATGHFATGNKSGKATNPKSLKVNKTKVSVKAGNTSKIKAKVAKKKAGLKWHGVTAKARYFSDNTKVATVSKKGVIKGVSKGWCRVYVQAENGIWKTIEVTVN